MSDDPKQDEEPFQSVVSCFRGSADSLFRQNLKDLSQREAAAFALACMEQCAEVFCFLDQPREIFVKFAREAYEFSRIQYETARELKKAVDHLGVNVSKTGKA